MSGEPPARLPGATEPGDDEQVMQRGAEAWLRLKQSNDWDDWRRVGAALQTGRGAAMHEVGADRPAGSRYNAAFGAWLRRYKLDDIDKSTRARLLTVMANLPTIEAYRAGLEPDERLKLNHPNSVLRRFKAAQPKARPDKTHRETTKTAGAAALSEATAALAAATDRLHGVVFPVECNYDLSSPQMIIESAANFRELHGAEATEQFASALRP
jgi:hypothetical protein